MTDINDILPEEISDETAYHLVNFFMGLALALESHYFGYLRRYARESEPPSITPYYLKKSPPSNDNPLDEDEPDLDENDF
jgi:hypothetical protein